MILRFRAESASARALPPLEAPSFDRATAAGFFGRTTGGLGNVLPSIVSPISSSTTDRASRFGSRGRFGLLAGERILKVCFLFMHINEDHMYHGAALTQIADRPEFKAINPFPGLGARGAFRINNDIAVYIKHAAAPTKTVHGEYLFGFSDRNRAEIDKIKNLCKKVFIVLVCVKDKQICVLTQAQFDRHIKNRQRAYHAAYGKDEKQPTILVTAKPGQKFRVYVNQAKKKGGLIGEILVSRNAFPNILFSN